MGRRSGDKTKPIFRVSDPQTGGYSQLRGSPQEAMSHSPTLGSPAHWAFPCTGKMIPRIFDFEAQQPCIQEDRKAVGSRLPSSMVHAQSYTYPTSQYRGSHLKGGCQTHVLNLRHPPPAHPDAEATGAHPRVINTLTQFTAVLGVHSDTRTLCWQAPYWSPSSLLTLEAHPLTSSTSTGTPWDTCQHCEDPGPLTSRQHQPSTPGPRHLHQDLAFPTSRAVLSPRPPGPLSATWNPAQLHSRLAPSMGSVASRSRVWSIHKQHSSLQTRQDLEASLAGGYPECPFRHSSPAPP